MKISTLVVGSFFFFAAMAAISIVGGPDVLVRKILELVFFPLAP